MPTLMSRIKRHDNSKLRLLCLFLSVWIGVPAALAQSPSPAQQPDSLGYGQDEKALAPIRQPLPDNSKEMEAALKEYRAKNLEDLRKMMHMLWEVRTELANSSTHVVSVQSIKKLEQVEKMSKTVRSRMLLH